VSADAASGRNDVLRISKIIVIGWGTSRNKLDGSVGNGVLNVSGEFESSGFDVSTNHAEPAWNKNGYLAFF
jgi:hypothetical protein